MQDYYGYAKNDAFDAFDDSGCYAELPLEVVLHESDQPKGSSNTRPAQKSFACDQLNQASTSAHQGIPLNCDICNKSFNEWYGLKAHKMSTHYGMAHECSICNKSFDHLSKLIRHKNTVHMKVTYPCALCGKLFRKMSTLKAHTVLSHQERHHEFAVCSESHFI